MDPHGTNTDRYIALLRLRGERRIFLAMGLAMSVCASLWAAWCLWAGATDAAMVPGLYVVLALLSLLGLWRRRTEIVARHTLLSAGIVLPFVLQMLLGGIESSGMVMLWCLPSLVASVNIQRGRFRYTYLIIAGTLLTFFAAFDPVLPHPILLSKIPSSGLLAFNLGTIMPANFLLADRMLATQRELRKQVFTIKGAAEKRFLETVEQRNLEMQQSLDYAGRIQMALWPGRERMHGLFQELHVHYRPKEAVGGDLIWHARVEDRSYFMVLDCTGHGVPGSLMSMLIHGLLNEVVHTGRNLSALQVVRRTQQLLSDRLDRERTGNTDGAEMAVLCFDHTNRRVTCCSLGCGILVQHGNSATHLRSHSSNSSLLTGERLNDLTEFQVTITEDTRLFLYTDGVADQFCAKDQRKFSRTRLENTLMQAADRSSSEQMDHFLKAFDEWRGETPQVDDLLLVSVVPHSCWRTVREEDENDLAVDAA
jgi:serine phosphatase RsbU (regulator of sigma subunit)